MQRLEGLERYLKGVPRVAQQYETLVSRYVHCVKIMVDSDNDGDLNLTRSTVGQVAFLGNHVVQHACNLLHVIALSSDENEYCAILVGSCAGLGQQSLLRDLCEGISANGIRFICRKKIHIETRTWRQDETLGDQILVDARTIGTWPYLAVTYSRPHQPRHFAPIHEQCTFTFFYTCHRYPFMGPLEAWSLLFLKPFSDFCLFVIRWRLQFFV